MRATPIVLVAVTLLLPLVPAKLSPAEEAPRAEGPLCVALCPVWNQSGVAQRTVFRAAGEEYGREDVQLDLNLTFRSIEFDAVGFVFGGGDLEAIARLEARLEMRVVSVERIEDALQEQTGERGANLSTIDYPADKRFLPADHFRTALAGEALAAFQAEEERLVKDLISDTFPELTILDSSFEWSNTDPSASDDGDAPGDRPNLREPPIVLTTTFDLQVIRRHSLVGVIEDAWRDDPPPSRARTQEGDDPRDARRRLLEELRDETDAPFYEKSAYSAFGLTQLVVLRAEPGWDMRLLLQLPEGYTYEEASPDVSLDGERRAARTATLAGSATGAVENPVAVSLSNRFLVTSLLLFTMLALGFAIRVPAMLLADRRSRRRG